MAEHHELVLDQCREELAEVEARREELLTMIGVLERWIAAEGSPSSGPLAAMSMPDAVLACLNTAGPLTKRDLMARLVKGGRTRTKTFNTHVGSTLTRLQDQGKVVRGDDGRWCRAEPKTVMSAATAGAGRPERS